MLQNSRDVQTIACMLALPGLATALWLSSSIHLVGYALLICLSFATPTMHHNHAHFPLWRPAALNRLTDLWFTLLFASNYLQHAGTNSDSPYDHSRNFTGAVNVLCFNIGLHTAHHMEPGAHWSNLSAVHARLAPRISPAFIETSVWGYCFRAWFTRRAPVTSP